MNLLPRHLLIRTGPVDHADWNYKPLLGTISRLRFSLVTAMLKGQVCSRLLELGYGSGVFLPELARFAKELYGTDIHTRHLEVSAQLAQMNLKAQLSPCDGKTLPYPDSFFSCVVAVSVIEFIEDLSTMCKEIQRVLLPDGCLVVITPGSSPLLDAGLRVLTGESAKRDYGNRRETVLPTLRRNFAVAEERQVGTPFLPLYTGLRLQALKEVRTPEKLAAA